MCILGGIVQIGGSEEKEKLSRIGAGVNAYEFSFDETLLGELRWVYDFVSKKNRSERRQRVQDRRGRF
jgi:hypothetical protein